MKRFAALALALAIFTAPALALAGEWNGPSLEEIFGDTYEQTIVFSE